MTSLFPPDQPTCGGFYLISKTFQNFETKLNSFCLRKNNWKVLVKGKKIVVDMYLRVWLKTTPYINPFIGMHSVIHSKNLPHKSYARKPWGQKGVIFLRPSSSIRNSINKRGSHNVIIKFTNAIINNNIIMAIIIVTHFYKVQIMHIKFFFPKVF